MSKELNNFTHCSKLDLIKMYKKSRRDMRRLSRQKVELEKENAELKEQNRKKEYQEENYLNKIDHKEEVIKTLQEKIEKMKCPQNCKDFGDCIYSRCPCDKWQLRR